MDVNTSFIGSHNRVTGIPGKTPQEAYLEGKRTLVVGVEELLIFKHVNLQLIISCH